MLAMWFWRVLWRVAVGYGFAIDCSWEGLLVCVFVDRVGKGVLVWRKGLTIVMYSWDLTGQE
jgi:hypothetical protein